METFIQRLNTTIEGSGQMGSNGYTVMGSQSSHQFNIVNYAFLDNGGFNSESSAQGAGNGSFKTVVTVKCYR